MQASRSRSRAVLSLFYRGVNMLPNQNVEKLSLLATSTRCLNSSGPSVLQTECMLQLPASMARRQPFPRKDLLFQQNGSRALCDKSNRAVEVDAKSSRSPEKVQQVASSAQHEHFGARNATNFDKRLLVYFGKYKTIEEVPQLVSMHLLNATRNKFRVYVNLFIAFLTMSGCGLMIYRGHKRAGQGETLADHNMRRHPQHYKQQQQQKD